MTAGAKAVVSAGMTGKKTYPVKELYALGPQKTLWGRKLDEIAFPLGGIGTGTISLGGWGQLRHWEIMNRQARVDYYEAGDNDNFFTIRVKADNLAVTKVLRGPTGGTYVKGGHGASKHHGEGLPHFRQTTFTGNYPFARVSLEDPDIPLKVTLEAFNPLIPLNDKDSSIPAAILLYRLKNPGPNQIVGTIFGNLRNVVGHPERKGRINQPRHEKGLAGLWQTTTYFDKDSVHFGSMALTTPLPKVRIWPSWNKGPYGRLSEFWRVVTGEDEFPTVPSYEGDAQVGTVAVDFAVAPGEETVIPFYITWHFPNMDYYWGNGPNWKNYYASIWADAWEVARYIADNFRHLYTETKLFHDTLFTSTLPIYVLDAVSSQISVLRSTTCLRLEDGTLYGFEGSDDDKGSCGWAVPVASRHVWNYAQALAYLFPNLQRGMREAEYRVNMADIEKITLLGDADGRMGTVLQVYREWQISGDDRWLRQMWPYTKNALESAWLHWDMDKDGIMEGVQPTTYDCSLWGPNTMVGSLYLGALRAAEEMARYFGEDKKAEEYHDIFLKGSRWTDTSLFNGEYYEQKVNPKAHLSLPEPQQKEVQEAEDYGIFSCPKWQYGKGCLSDQMIGQWYARMLGLGDLYDHQNVRNALQSVFNYNWFPSLENQVAFGRIFALNNEAGLVVATWPRGERPRQYLGYADAVWTGVEYQVASHMIYEGLIKEGLSMVRGLRNRHDGERRNPWDEMESGHCYVRAMSSYALLLALSGFSYSAPRRRIGFSPRLFENDFAAFFCVASGWGMYHQNLTKQAANFRIEVKYGSLQVAEFIAPKKMRTVSKVKVDLSGKDIPASLDNKGKIMTVVFDKPVNINRGEALTIKLTDRIS